MQIKTDSRYEVLYPETLTSQLNGDISSIEGYVKPWKVGDVLVTSRKDLSDNWLLCNGAQITGADYPLLSGTGIRQNTPLDTGYTKVNTTAFDNMYEWQDSAAMGRVGAYKVLFALSTDYNALRMWYSLDGNTWTLKQIDGTTMGGDVITGLTLPNNNEPLIVWFDTGTDGRFLMKVNSDLTYAKGKAPLNYARSICWDNSNNRAYMVKESQGSWEPQFGAIEISSDGSFINGRTWYASNLSYPQNSYNNTAVYTNGSTIFAALGNSTGGGTDFFRITGLGSATKIKTVSGIILGNNITYDKFRDQFVSILGGTDSKVYVSKDGVNWEEKTNVSRGGLLYITEQGDYIINYKNQISCSVDGGESWSSVNNTGLNMIASTQIDNNWYTFSYENYNSGNNRRFQMNKLLNKKVLPTYTPADNLSAYIKAKEGE